MRRVHYATAGAIGAALLVFSVVGQQGLRFVTTSSPGLIFGKGTPASPLNVVVSVDGSSITGAGTAGSPISATGALSIVDFGLFGDGSDAAASPCGTISIDTSLSRSIYCTSLTVNSGVTLNPNGWRIYVKGTLQLDGKIARNGGDASGITGGTTAGNNELCTGSAGGLAGLGGCGASPTVGTCQGQGSINLDECSNSGGGGGTSPSGTGSTSTSCKGGGGGGGTLSAGCASGTVSPASLSAGSFRAPYSLLFMQPGSGRGSDATPFTQIYWGGTGGGAGGGGGSGCSGGGGGGGGGNILVVARKIAGSGSIEAKGGAGANAAAGSPGAVCGGGGGGGGGNIVVIIGTGSFPTLVVTGGLHGNGAGNGGVGGNGADGSSGKTVTMKAGI